MCVWNGERMSNWTYRAWCFVHESRPFFFNYFITTARKTHRPVPVCWAVSHSVSSRTPDMTKSQWTCWQWGIPHTFMERKKKIIARLKKKSIFIQSSYRVNKACGKRARECRPEALSLACCFSDTFLERLVSLGSAPVQFVQHFTHTHKRERKRDTDKEWNRARKWKKGPRETQHKPKKKNETQQKKARKDAKAMETWRK